MNHRLCTVQTEQYAKKMDRTQRMEECKGLKRIRTNTENRTQNASNKLRIKQKNESLELK